MKLRIVSVILMCCLWASTSLALTQEDCRQISQTYGLVPSECEVHAFTNNTNIHPLLGNSLAPNATAQLSEPSVAMRQNNIFFQQGGADLNPEALLQVQQLANLLNGDAMQRTCVQLVGHSDSSGSSLINWEIGAQRATAVRNRLALLLRNPSQVETISSKGEDAPLVGITPDSRWQRRVEIWARDCPNYLLRPQ